MKELAIAIRNYNRDNYKEIIDTIKDVGFKNVFIEWYNNDLKLQEDILNYVNEKELNVIFAHLGYQNPNVLWLNGFEGEKEVDRYLNDLDVCKEKGFDLVVIHPTYEYSNPGISEIGLRRIMKIVSYAKELGINVAFENVELKGYLEYIISNIDLDNLGICFDVGHCNLFFDGDFDTKFFKDKVLVIHLHDNYKKEDDHNLPFDGTVDWDKAIKQINELNYNGYVVLECGYKNLYSNITIKEYYNLAYERGLKIIDMLQTDKK
ncbi:MAG: sugar phosphate isomerase/epimerase [Bacilli bacterium]|nr:sugar phosphate isomerase/epimerase [Bacilli bacterium]